jgi:hypothetical protein
LEVIVMNARDKVGRQIQVKGMAYAPTNEQGVVLLFGRLARALGFCVERVQTAFPDCMARRRGERCRIEFEFWASDYENHGHPADGADIVVCWENDWESRSGKYKHLEIIDLKKLVGAEPRVYQVGCGEADDGSDLWRSHTEWSVPRDAQVGDLIIMYRKTPESAIHDLWRIVGPYVNYAKHNKRRRKPGLQAGLKNVVRLGNPLTFAELKRDPRTQGLGVVIKRFQGTTDVTDDWPILYQKIVSLNPKAKKRLRRYSPD